MLHLVSDSRASDASIRALADAAHVATCLDAWLIVGGHMVNLHVLRTAVDVAPRATRDADLAVELLAIRRGPLLDRLRELGYRNATTSNRFNRETSRGTTTIDLLVPSYSHRHSPNMDAGDIAVDGFPALSLALARTPTVLDVHATLTDQSRIETRIRIPDVVSAIAFKIFAYAGRYAARDAEDLNCLFEVAHAEGLTAADWPDQSSFREAARLLSVLFDAPGKGLAAATASRSQRVRLRALVRSIVGRR